MKRPHTSDEDTDDEDCPKTTYGRRPKKKIKTDNKAKVPEKQDKTDKAEDSKAEDSKAENSKAENSKADKHNNVEYYIRGSSLDTTDVSISRVGTRIYFYAPITRANAANLIGMLKKIDTEHIDDNTKPIHLHMLSEGGDVFSALAVYQNINTLKSPVYAYVDGFVSSASLIILLSCTKRFMGEHSFLAIHSIKMNVWGKLNYIQSCHSSYHKIWESLEKIYEKHTKLKQHKKNIIDFMSADKWLNTSEALKFGFITDLM
jgi:ATP-dependent protease ClpP protease subunit